MADTRDPRYHTERIQGKLDHLIRHVREDVQEVEDARQAKALFETSVEVLTGLKTAYQHYERESDPAWRGSGRTPPQQHSGMS